MSFDEYARYLAQKFRLAISLAVIRTKPQNSTIQDHIQLLRDNINKTEDFSLSINSNDFNFDETGITDDNFQLDDEINDNDFDIGDVNDHNFNKNDKRPKTNDDFNQKDGVNDGRYKTGDKIYLLHDIDKINETNDVEMIETQDLNDSFTILENLDVDMVDRTNLDDVLDVLKGVHNDIEEVTTQSRTHLNNDAISQNFDDTIYDSLNTQNELTLTEVHNYSKVNCVAMYNDQKITENVKYFTLVENHIENTDRKYAHTKNNNTANIDTKETNKVKNSNKIATSHNTSQDLTYFTIDNYSETQNNIIIIDDRYIHGNKNEMDQIKNSLKHEKVTKLNKQDVFEANVPVVDLTAEEPIVTENNSYKNYYEEINKQILGNDLTQISQISSNSTFNNDFGKQDSKRSQYNKSTVNNYYSQNSQIWSYSTNANEIERKRLQDNKNTDTDSTNINKVSQNKEIESKSRQDNTNKDATISQNSQISSNSTNTKNLADQAKYDPKTKNTPNTDFSQNLLNFTKSQIEKENMNIDKDIFLTNTLNQEIWANLSQDSELDDSLFPLDKSMENTPFSPENCTQFDITQLSYKSTNLEENTLSYTYIEPKTNLNFDNKKDIHSCSKFDENLQKGEPNKNTINKLTYIDKSKNIFNLENKISCAQFDENLLKAEAPNKNELNKLTYNENPKTKLHLESESANLNENLQTELKNKIIDTQNKDVQKSCADFDKNFNDNLDIEDTNLIPFKILEEMNKVKKFLNRKSFVECSSDAGYKSDSQSRNSNKLSQSPSWLNQSAHSLLNYIMEYPLLENTEEITKEISEVLGELIDKLHEDENYPSFLEVLLDSVKSLLKSIYEGNTDENVLLKKDDNIERLIFLNKSIHIQKFTIEKISNILEELHKSLTNSDMIFEIENTDKAENICYIFHILQTLLKKYKKSLNFSQNTQTQCTDDDRILKKSSITDFWKKKWNPNFKSEKSGVIEKKCPISSCMDILNKIIVNCIGSYSLVSYSALKCFNVMQK